MKNLPKNTLSTIYLQGILPSVSYGLSIWGNCSRVHLERLDDLHIKASRFIHRITKKIPDSRVLSLSGWKSFDEMYKHRLACITYKLQKSQLPESLSIWKMQPRNKRNLRNNHIVDVPKFNKISYKRSFAYRSAVLWNQLSNKCADSATLNTFKNESKNELHTISFENGGIIRNINDDFIYY